MQTKVILGAALSTFLVIGAAVSQGQAPARPSSTKQSTSARQVPQQNPAKPAAPDQAPASDALSWYSAGLEEFLVDPKDKGLITALRLLDERVAELPREMDKPQIPGAALQLVVDLLFSSKGMRAGVIENNQAARGAPPFYGQFNFFAANQQQADALSKRFTDTIAAMAPFPRRAAPDKPGMNVMDVNGVPIYFGTIKVGEQWAFALGVNKVDQTPVKPGRAELPPGVEPVFAGTLDAQKLKPLFDMILSHPGAQQQLRGAQMQLEMMGLYGPNAATISAAMGYGPDRGHATLRYSRYRKLMEQYMPITDQRLTADDLRRVPADATYAQISKYDLAGIGKMYERMFEQAGMQMQQEIPDIMAMIEEETGVHPQRDVFDHLGQTLGVYMSDTTGGGGLLSLVGFAQVKNADALNQTMSRITGRLNQLAQQNAKGYVRISERKLNGQTVTVLTFPGLPIPLELCWATSGGYLYAAGSPQALLAAIKQGQGGSPGLADNPHFKEMGGDKLGSDAIQVSFVDTPKLMREGYGLVNLGVSALANLVRSPSDPSRDPGVLMPSYTELAQGAKASVTIARIQGDDLVATCQHDRSLLVNACGLAGIVGGPVGAAAFAGAIAGSAAGQAQHHAMEHMDQMHQMHLQSSEGNLRELGMALQLYAVENNDRFPNSVDKLLQMEFVTADVFDSPAGDAADGGPDYWFDTSAMRLSAVRNPDRRILAYDRVMYEGGQKVSVLFVDAHVETMPISKFQSLITQPPNGGIDFELPE
ncbi:MAG: DUF3352 domain-containing protein [Phycisphaerales bacterium]|nr:DUF3352 domain-containing protein [Phycisphaerales bacterium]